MLKNYLLAAAAVLLLTSCGGRPEQPLVFIGIDGAEWDLIDMLIGEGEMPNFARLKAEGAWGHLINTGPLSSPVAWTTFSTGHFARDHGILGFTYPYGPGTDKRPVSSLDKRKPDLWDIASDYGLSVSVVGYFVSHPAEPINGIMISDRATQDLPGSVTPPGAVSSRDIEWAAEGAGGDAWMARFFPWYHKARRSDNPARKAAAAYIDGTNVMRLIRREGFAHTQTLRILKDQPDILVSYYRLPDVISHTLWQFHDDRGFAEPVDESLAPFLGSAVRDAYLNMDRCLGEILERTDPRTNLVIVSDHGMGPATGAYATRRERDFPISGSHRSDGIIIAHGPQITPGPIVEMNNLDVMPTLMALAKLPVSDALPGDVRSDILTPDYLATHPIRTLTDYRAETAQIEQLPVADLAAEEETMATLQGLGYIGSDVHASNEIASEDVPVWKAEPRLFADALTGELIFYLLRQDDDAVQGLLDQVAGHAPDRLDFLKRQLDLRTQALLNEAPLTAATRAALERSLTALRDSSEAEPGL